jgi:uncharacterized membrane protein YphA (DoxX/SURF4 family)
MLFQNWLVNAFIAITEILGGLLVLLPKTRAVGALLILPIIIGILAHHFHHDPAGIVPGLVGNFTLDFRKIRKIQSIDELIF